MKVCTPENDQIAPSVAKLKKLSRSNKDIHLKVTILFYSVSIHSFLCSAIIFSKLNPTSLDLVCPSKICQFVTDVTLSVKR